MAFKIKQKSLTFADLEQEFQVKKNRSLDTLMNMEKAVKHIDINNYNNFS